MFRPSGVLNLNDVPDSSARLALYGERTGANYLGTDRPAELSLLRGISSKIAIQNSW